MKMIHHHYVGAKLVKFDVTSKEGILDQSCHLSLTEPSRPSFSLIEDCIKFGEQFLMSIKFKFCDLLSRSVGVVDLAFN